MSSKLDAFTHLIDRTSPTGRGERFIGKCRWCGRENLRMRDALAHCDAAEQRSIDQSESLMQALESPIQSSTTKG